MKIFFINESFEDEIEGWDEELEVWEQGVEWDEVNLFITLDDMFPKVEKMCISVGYMGDGMYFPRDSGYGDPEWAEWEGPLGYKFYRRAIIGIFDNEF